MGNMSEEMRKVMAKWNAAPEAQAPQQEQPAAEEGQVERKKRFYREEIYEVIKNNPGITASKALEVVTQRGIKQTYSAITSQITTLYQDFRLRREQIPNPAGIGRAVYTYFAVPDDVAARLKAEHKRKILQQRLRAERARQAKAEKAAARMREEEQQAAQQVVTIQPQIQLPLPLVPESTPTPAPAAPYNVQLQYMTAIDILNAINFAQARDLYKELKEAFGG